MLDNRAKLGKGKRRGNGEMEIRRQGETESVTQKWSIIIELSLGFKPTLD